MNATITWDEDRKTGKGTLTLRCDDGTVERMEHQEPINSGTDSNHIASLFGEWDSVEHNGQYIHCHKDDDVWYEVVGLDANGDAGDVICTYTSRDDAIAEAEGQSAHGVACCVTECSRPDSGTMDQESSERIWPDVD